MHLRKIALPSQSPVRQMAFYGGTLGLPAEMDGGTAIIRAGTTSLQFYPDESASNAPCHFAFNIPSNLLLGARRWLGQRVPLMNSENGDLFEFPTWNAHAMYFKDPDGNLAELIARHDLAPVDGETFEPRHILNVSEIGIAVEDVKGAAGFLQREFQLPVYRTAAPAFAAVGDPAGLLILAKSGRPWYPTTDMLATPSPAGVVLDGPQRMATPIPGSQCTVESGPG